MRRAFGLLGAVMVLFPKHVQSAFERVAIKNPDAVTPRRTFRPAIRLEGLVVSVLAHRGGRSYAWMSYLVGLGGILSLLFPRQTLDVSASITYEDPDAVEWNEGFLTAVRVVGLLYLLLAIDAYRNRKRKRSKPEGDTVGPSTQDRPSADPQGE